MTTLVSPNTTVEPCSLMEREAHGLRVELVWHPEAGLTLIVQEGEDVPMVADIPDEKALDAFHHPYCYLPR